MSGQNFLQRLCLVIKKKATSNPTPPQCQMSEGKAREKARNQTFIGLLQHNQTIHVRSPARARFSIRLCVCVVLHHSDLTSRVTEVDSALKAPAAHTRRRWCWRCQFYQQKTHIVLVVTLAGEPAGQVTEQDSLKNTCQCCKVFQALRSYWCEAYHFGTGCF